LTGLFGQYFWKFDLLKDKTLKHKRIILIALVYAAGISGLGLIGGCGSGYNNGWLYPEEVSSVYVEMFDSRSFRRNHEFDLTDAICKRIEAQTPYKIVSDRNSADSVLSGQISSIGRNIITYERNTGKTFEEAARVIVQVSWLNLKNNEMLLDNERVTAVASYSKFFDQDFDYASKVAVNRAAERIVERMQNEW
jgi:hypothetical protein